MEHDLDRVILLSPQNARSAFDLPLRVQLFPCVSFWNKKHLTRLLKWIHSKQAFASAPPDP
jgi:hypothetical protein